MAEKTWEESVQYAKSRSILDVAADLNMELFRQGKEYRWKEHDSLVITPSNNLWNWFSKEGVGGDVIELVQTIKEVDFKQAVAYLNTGDFKQVAAQTQVSQEAFRYYLAPYEQPFDEARRYLKEERGLSDDTIDFFYDKGVLAQANAKVGDAIEPVLVFKNLDENGQVVGASLQGLVANPDKYFGRGYFKQIMKNSQPYNGMHVDIGTPNRLVFTESSIDLMSYYELHKDSLSDVRLVSLEGLKTGTMGRHLVQLEAEMKGRSVSSSWDAEKLAHGLDEAVSRGYFKDDKNSQLLTLAVDNDPKGQQLIKGLRDKGIAVIDATPPKQEDQFKMDWNDYLKQEKGSKMAKKTAETEISPSNTSLRQLTYKEIDSDNKALSRRLQEKIQVGELTIRYADDAYFYDVFNRLGNNHPTKLLTEKRLEVLKPLRKQLEMITLDNVDAYKQKGTPEQDYLYKEMKQLQRQLGTDISTRFIGELAIAAYNTNNELKGLQADTFGTRFYPETTLEMFSQTIGRIIEYPLIEAGVRTDYNFVTTPNAFFHYLNNQSGEVIINKEILDNLTTQIKNSPIAIISETKEQEVMASIKKASDVNLKQEKKNETIIGDLSEITQKAAPVPEVIKSQPLKELSPTQSESHSELYFTIKDPDKSIYKNNYHVIDDEDLVKLNNNADIVQNSARWYLDNLADSTIHYFYQKEGRVYDVSLRFEERHYMHLTGIFPIKRGQTAEKTLHDFADGKGDYDNILISNRDATFQKIKALPDMKAILQVNAFYFDNVEDIPKLQSLNMEQAIQSHDKDILLAYQSNGENLYPASLMEVTRQLKSQLDRSEHANTILGIYSERNGEITPLSINHRYVKDGGQEMLRLLQSKSYQNGSVEEANRESMIAKPPLSQKSHLKEGIQRQAKEAMDDLVVSSAEKNKDFDYHNASAYELSQQAIQAIKAFTEFPEDLKAYLDFMSRFPQLSPRNAALIQAQWPGANAVATFKQWQELGKALDLGDADVMASKRTYTNKRTGESKEVVDHNLSVKAGEKSQITLFRPVMVAMIPVLDDKGKQVINQKGNPKFKPLSQATPDEKALVKAQKLKVSHFQDVDVKGNRKFMTYKVFELSQTTLKPESYPKAMPNRHYDFNLDQVKTKEVLQGLQDYANYIKVSIATDGQNGQDKQLGNAKGAFYPLEQKIVLNPNNTQGETISTTIHELAHATLHNPQLTQGKQNDLSKPQKELEAEMTSYLVSKHFGLDTAEKAIPYMAKWTKQLKGLTDEDLSRSMTRVHQTVARMVKSVETYTQPYALKKSPTRPQAQLKKPNKGRNL
ncbi:PBECR4 domain-containing protein [Streptococcus agalactiae]|uniref:PBECR4 domain-containing protein n=1 Tax=Streptococcus agalactiae TaxID=1311 RepID=UPI00085CAEF2|nr:PBECR4 domain-containing protein [Streptococcus agalactiae]